MKSCLAYIEAGRDAPVGTPRDEATKEGSGSKVVNDKAMAGMGLGTLGTRPAE